MYTSLDQPLLLVPVRVIVSPLISVAITVAYFGYSESNGSLSGETAAAASPDVEAGLVFTSVNDTVTAKDEVRLRDKPSQDTDATVIATFVPIPATLP